MTLIFSSVSDYAQVKNPRFYVEVCQQMGILPYEMAQIGDSWELDFLAPREVRIKAFHLDGGGYMKNEDSVTSLADLEVRLSGN